MIGSLISLIGGVGSSIFGGIAASKAAKERKKNIKKREAENQAWYDRRRNEDETQKADAQRLITMTKDAIRERNRAVAGRQAVMGGTDESVAAEKARGNKMLGDVISNINAQGVARKERVENQYLARKDKINSDIENTELQKARDIQKAASQAGNIFALAGAAIDKYGNKLSGTRSSDSDDSGDDDDDENKKDMIDW